MTYATIMIHLEPGHPNTRLLDTALNFSSRFDANVIGIAVGQPLQMMYGDLYVSGEMVKQDMQEEEARLEVAKIEFFETFKSYAGNVDWRSATVLEPLADYVARKARCANLLVTHVQSDASSNPHRLTNTGDLVLKAGRPVLVVAANADPLRLDHLMIAWKDTREARRAVLDALPLLSKTRRVTVVELAAISELADAKIRVDDVCHWLNKQSITSEAMVVQSSGNDVQTLESVAQSLGVGIVVAGAYGHSRLREWVFGGFTSTLLHPSSRCAFLSH